MLHGNNFEMWVIPHMLQLLTIQYALIIAIVGHLTSNYFTLSSSLGYAVTVRSRGVAFGGLEVSPNHFIAIDDMLFDFRRNFSSSTPFMIPRSMPSRTLRSMAASCSASRSGVLGGGTTSSCSSCSRIQSMAPSRPVRQVQFDRC